MKNISGSEGKVNIAIIGGGPSGISAYLQIIKNLHLNIKSITVFDPIGIANSFGFNTDLESSLANTSIGITSLYEDDKMDYYNWFGDKKPELNVSISDFVSRSYFRDYCKDRFKQSSDYALSYDCSTYVVKKEAKKISYKNKKMIVLDSSNNSYSFDFVILATGNKTVIPTGLNENIKNFISHPYPERNFINRIVENSNILILGSKLSAVDISVNIFKKIPKLKITMVSNSGYLPSVRSSILLKNNKKFKLNMINDFKYEKEINKNSKNKLIEDINSCRLKSNYWEGLIAQFIEKSNEEIPLLSYDDKNKFNNEFKYFIKNYVSSFPLQNADILLNAFEKNIFRIIRSSFNDYLTIKNNLIYGNNDSNLEKFDLVINASGIEDCTISDITIDSLFSFGVKKNDKGGLKVNPKNMKVYSDNQIIPLYLVGSPSIGEIPIINYVRSSVVQAKKIVKDFMMNIEKVKNDYI